MAITERRVSRDSAKGQAALALVSGLTTLAIVLQVVVAGQFVSQNGTSDWVTVHGVVADAVWALALATAVVAFVTRRGRAGGLVLESAALSVLTLAQTGIGHLITDKGQDGWIAVHVPVAFVIFALSVRLSLQSLRLPVRRVAGLSQPHAARHEPSSDG